MRRSYFIPALSLLSTLSSAAPSTPQWSFNLKEATSGIVALESIVVSPTLTIFFNRPSVDPLQFNNHSALGALWDLKTSTVVKPLNVISNTFCGSGALLSNGSMVIRRYHLVPDASSNPCLSFLQVSVGGDSGAGVVNAGNQAIRIFEPCLSPTGEDCTLFENLETHHLFERRWYASSIRIFDGSLMIVGGTHVTTPFYNVDPVNSFEFFPKKESAPRPSPFLERSLPANLFPRYVQRIP